MIGKNHRELLVWQKVMRLVVAVYDLVRRLPKEENYGLSDQMRRAAISIPSNIAEGNARCSVKDMAHFFYIAQGS
jgi:S23 ribosomal protein